MFRKLRLQRFQPAWRLTVPRSPWLLILVVPLAMYVWYVAGNDGNSKTEALRRGDELTKKNRPLQAAAAYQIAAEQDPNDGEVLVKLAKAYEAAGKWSDAAREGVRAADLLPGNLEVQSLAVTRLNRIRKFFEARARSSRLLESHPDDPDLLVGWANSTSRLPDTSWALYTFPDRVVSADGFDKVRRSLRREIPESDDAEAGAAVRKARRLAPDSWQIQLALVNFLWATGRPDEAEPMLKDLADRNTSHVAVSYALASFYRWRGMDADAETYMKRAAASVQNGRNARFALAEMYIKSNRNEEALAILVAMPATDDESGKASLLAAGIEFQLSLYPSALQRVERLLERFPHNQAAGLLKAQLLFAVGRVDESLKFARDAVTASPRSGEAHAALGQALLATGDLTRAFEEYTEAARLSPAAAKPQWQLARLSLDLGRDKAALVYARNAAREFPGDRDAGVMLVEALIRNRDLSAAEFALRPLQSSFPGSPGVLVQTGALQAARGEARAARASFVKALEIAAASTAGAVGARRARSARARNGERPSVGRGGVGGPSRRFQVSAPGRAGLYGRQRRGPSRSRPQASGGRRSIQRRGRASLVRLSRRPAPRTGSPASAGPTGRTAAQLHGGADRARHAAGTERRCGRRARALRANRSAGSARGSRLAAAGGSLSEPQG